MKNVSKRLLTRYGSIMAVVTAALVLLGLYASPMVGTFGQTTSQASAAAPGSTVTYEQLVAIYHQVGAASTVRAGLPSLNQQMRAAAITTAARKAALLATLRNESGFRYNALQPGSSTYRGRGFIQLTGVGNYRAAGNALRHNFVSRPDDARSLAWSAKIAAWYWTSRHINAAADRLDMGAVDDAIGYAHDRREDTQRCNDFKAALKYYLGRLPSGINCRRHH